MGTVVRAFDRELKREVALKLIRDAGQESTRRFLKEAQAQASINHDNVCRVFDAGFAEESPFIAMQLVEGGTLRKLSASLTMAEQVSLVAQAADGIHAAHRMGLVHRDIKPSNIMVERVPDGSWKAVVVDFGLVRELGDEARTATSWTAGTPAYMAPEQVRNERDQIDWRTDVYGLGVTLFEVLTGDPPFSTESPAHMLLQVLQREARFPPGSAVPRDLQAVVLKCLEKEPFRRYGSARELGDELRRFLAGRPVLARPAGSLGRVARAARRHPRITTLASVAILAVLALAGLWANEAARSRRTAALARRFGEEAAAVEAQVRIAALLQAHNVQPEREAVRARLRAMETELPSLGRDAEGPGYFAFGRGLVALGEYREARGYLEKAWAKGFVGPDVAVVLGECLVALYLQAREDAQRIANPSLRKFRLEAAQKELRDPALDMLRQGVGSDVGTPKYAEALIALVENRWEVARERAQEALRATPALFEARRLEGDAWVAEAGDAEMKGEWAPAMQGYLHAGDAYAAGVEMARSDPALHEALCDQKLHVIEVTVLRGDSPEPLLASLDKTCRQAQVVNPAGYRAFDAMAMARSRLSQHQGNHGVDPRPASAECERLANEALRRNPEDVNALNEIGLAAWRIADYEAGHSGSPRVAGERGVAALERAIALNAGFVGPYNTLGNVLNALAQCDVREGKDPRPTLDHAREVLEAAIKVSPEWANPYNTLAIGFLWRGQYEEGEGLDPRPAYSRAIELFEEAAAHNKGISQPLSNAVSVLNSLASYEWSQGGDPGKHLDAALEDARRAMERDATNYSPVFNSGTAESIRAEWELSLGRDPTAAIGRSRVFYERCLTFTRDDADIFRELARLDVFAGRQALAQQRDPLPTLATVEKYLHDAEKLDPSSVDNIYVSADAWLCRAGWARLTHRSELGAVASARAALDRADALDNNSSRTWLRRGKIDLFVAEGELPGAQRAAHARAAIEAFDRAKQISPVQTFRFRADRERAVALAAISAP